MISLEILSLALPDCLSHELRPSCLAWPLSMKLHSDSNLSDLAALLNLSVIRLIRDAYWSLILAERVAAGELGCANYSMPYHKMKWWLQLESQRKQCLVRETPLNNSCWGLILTAVGFSKVSESSELFHKHSRSRPHNLPKWCLSKILSPLRI